MVCKLPDHSLKNLGKGNSPGLKGVGNNQVIGPIAIGIRRTMECIDIPIAVFEYFRESVISDMLAGRETALQAEKKIIPINTATQLVNKMAIVYPIIAMMLNTKSDFR